MARERYSYSAGDQLPDSTGDKLPESTGEIDSTFLGKLWTVVGNIESFWGYPTSLGLTVA